MTVMLSVQMIDARLHEMTDTELKHDRETFADLIDKNPDGEGPLTLALYRAVLALITQQENARRGRALLAIPWTPEEVAQGYRCLTPVRALL